ncbi:FAD-dependent thymidylate synthase [Thermodesulfobacterium hydrogeniphilum]|uniref:FAD-dependent thymidylate synthase n=1 Tax=Thermodesulfobacterium hydrogeniphilum TaxID=161156 RepID=UPI000570B501|nr:FAD-dependent thymidylate synthase [Thermodesulfobacterium hydrogeniphilum]
MKLSNLKDKQKELINKVLEKADLSLLPHFLFFSYLGARICYAESHPLALFYEEKFKDYEKFKGFLLHLKKMGHFSVFAHTPIFINTEDFTEKEKVELAQTYFKVFWDEKNNLALFNLRHFAENLEEKSFIKLIETPPDLSSVEIKFFKNFEKIYEGSFLKFPSELIEKEDNNIWAIPEVIIIEIEISHPFRWIGVIVHNFSRIFSHQFVRHTWLNFNQRSHRYTSVDKFVVPEVFTEKHIEIYRKLIEEGMKVYKEFCKDMKKESARFVVPQGVATSLIATGPSLVWEDFITKRAIPQAQEEIRRLAYLLKNNLSL